jgi:hypothetical protein
MTQQKKKNFGLAAQLTQPRPSSAAPEPESTTGPTNAESRDDAAPAASNAELPTVRFEGEAIETTKRFGNTDHTKRRVAKEKKPGAPSREGGYVRRTITLGPALSDYVDRAWRTYKKPNGGYVKGVSGFIEAVIDEHRRRAT